MTIDSVAYPPDSGEFLEIVNQARGSLLLEGRLPSWAFTSQSGTLAFCQYPHITGGAFSPVLAALGRAHGDEYITIMLLSPDPAAYFEWYRCYPAMRLRAADIEQTYWPAMSFEPQGDVTGAPINIANIVGIVGDSGRWAVWAERRWDLGILMSDIPSGPWLDSGVPFVSPEAALEDFTRIGASRSPVDFDRGAFIQAYARLPYAVSSK